MDNADRQPCPRGYLLRGCIAAYESFDRSRRQRAAAVAIFVRAVSALGTICHALVGNPRALAGGERAAACLCPQDADPAVCVADGVARHCASDPRGGCAVEGALMLLAETLAILMVAAVIAALMAGYPVALTLAR